MTPFIGQISLFGFNFEPRGWALCDGRLLAISQYSALFSLIGTYYGGDGRDTFGLPDLRGRVPLAFGQGPGLTNRQIGQKGGAESTSLTVTQLPSHSHPASATANLPCTSGAGTSDTPAGSIPAGSATDENHAAAGSANGVMAPLNVSVINANTGGGQPVPILPPYLALNFCIALEGIFPSRN